MEKAFTFQSSLIHNIHNLSRDFIDKHYKIESIYFDNIWQIYEPELKKWIKTSPEKWRFKAKKSRLMGAFGFSDPTERPDITAPIIIGVIAATFWHIGTLSSEPTKEAIEKMIEDYSGKFGALGHVKETLKEFLISTNVLNLIKSGLLTFELERKKEVLEKKAIKREDTIEIGIKDRRPYVDVNGEEITQFQTKHKQFVNLVVLAAARRAEEDWVNKKDLDPGQGDQVLSDIRSFISPSLFGGIKRRDVIISDEQRNEFVKLGVFRSKENITIMESIREYESVFLERAKKLVNKIQIDLKLEEKGEIDKSIIEKECSALDRQASIMEKQMECMERGLKKIRFELKNQEWRAVVKRSIEILMQLGHRFKYMIP